MNRARTWGALALAALTALLLASPGLATIGMTEWQIVTPGGNRIAHLDPWKENYGTCLIGGRGDDTQSAEAAEVLIAHIRWWQYYRTYVIGETDSGYFLFDEVSRFVSWYDSVEAARTHARQRSGGGPLSEPMTPATVNALP
jgi:hypothetical protein